MNSPLRPYFSALLNCRLLLHKGAWSAGDILSAFTPGCLQTIFTGETEPFWSCRRHQGSRSASSFPGPVGADLPSEACRWHSLFFTTLRFSLLAPSRDSQRFTDQTAEYVTEQRHSLGAMAPTAPENDSGAGPYYPNLDRPSNQHNNRQNPDY